MNRRRGDRGTGLVPTTVGFGAFVLGLLLAVQLLFGLHARTTVTAVATDVIQHAAVRPVDATSLASIEPAIRERLGRYGDEIEVHVSLADLDGDGDADTLAATVDAALPTFTAVPALGAGRFTRTVAAYLDPRGVAT